jgi:hypothetical protein
LRHIFRIFLLASLLGAELAAYRLASGGSSLPEPPPPIDRDKIERQEIEEVVPVDVPSDHEEADSTEVGPRRVEIERTLFDSDDYPVVPTANRPADALFAEYVPFRGIAGPDVGLVFAEDIRSVLEGADADAFLEPLWHPGIDLLAGVTHFDGADPNLSGWPQAVAMEGGHIGDPQAGVDRRAMKSAKS